MNAVNPPRNPTNRPEPPDDGDKPSKKKRKRDNDSRQRNPVTPGVDDKLGEACKHLRTVKGWGARSELSRASGISMETLGNLERGEQAWSAAHVWKVAKACGVQPSTLYISAGLEVPTTTPEEATLADPDLTPTDKSQAVRYFRALRTANGAV